LAASTGICFLGGALLFVTAMKPYALEQPLAEIRDR
jgi:hypothetical protein